MSEATYKVEEILGQNEWAPADDPTKRTIYWSFRAEGVEPVCEIGRKPGNDLQVGESFQATSREDRGKLKLKRVQPQQNGYSGGQRAPFKEDPLKSVRILRQHSQTAAISALEVAMGVGIQKPPESLEEFLKLVRRTSDFLDRDVETTVANRALSVDDAQRRSEDGF